MTDVYVYYFTAAAGEPSGGVSPRLRATLEAIGFQTRDVVLAMEEDLGHKLGALKVDGGITANALSSLSLAPPLAPSFQTV